MNIKIEKLFNFCEKNATKLYLIAANLILVIFAIWFSNAGLLPFANFSDFCVFAVLALILALYRPSWTFAFFVGTLALENINIAPKGFLLTIRPYQFFGFLTIVSLIVQVLFQRLSFSFPKWKWHDALPIVFLLGGFLSATVSLNKATSLKQSIIALTFAIFYYLVRIYIQSLNDLKRIAPFFASSAMVILFYGVWQNIRFLHGAYSFEVMPGRPNATFTEPDWYGIYLTFLLAVLFALMYAFEFEKYRKVCLGKILNYLFLIIIFGSLILTVSRSAWLGASLITLGFLKIILTNGSLKVSHWNGKKFLLNFATIIIALGISAGLAIMLTRFQISNRAVSTGGLQKITIACDQNHSQLPETIGNITELSQYGCKFINLEDIVSEKKQGQVILEILRPDPTVNIRSQIYQKSIAQVKAHPVLGIGWGSISQILGTDERGAGLNASNIFLEIYLGSGILGFASFITLLVWILFFTAKKYFSKQKNKISIVFVALGWFAIVVPNLFNSGIFLGFVWVYLAVAVSLLEEKLMSQHN